MKTEILNRLAKIETDFDIKILYAIESGSRAWGFESTASIKMLDELFRKTLKEVHFGSPPKNRQASPQ